MDLKASAFVTAQQSPDDTTAIQLGSEIRMKDQPIYSVGRRPDVGLRSMASKKLLESFAERQNISLYGADGPFPLLPDIWDDYEYAFEHFGDTVPAGVLTHNGCDERGRNMMRLVAEALSQHPEGTEHLLWRSKTFQRGTTQLDP
jgi:hypothetical protein